MKRVLILTRHDSRAAYDQKDTYEAALGSYSSRADYMVEEFESLVFLYGGKNLNVLLSDGKTDVAEFDAVFLVGWFKQKILEDIALSVSLYLESKGVKTINSEALYTRSRSKLSQYVYAVLNDIKATPFLFSLDPSVLGRALADKWGFGYPIIMKGVQASRGNDNHLVATLSQADEIISHVSYDEGPWFIVQRFVPNEGDYRIIVMGDEIRLVIHRQSVSGSHINNTSKGGQAKLIDIRELPPRLIKDSVKLAKLLRREVAGVDVIKHKDTGEYYLLEINNMPQLATGSYVDAKIKVLDEYLSSL